MAKGKKLNAYVHVTDPNTGEYVQFGPGSDVPSWASEQITNPNVWADDTEESERADVFLTDTTREQMIRAAERIGVEVTNDMSKDLIAAAIKRKLFQDAHEDAELTGDDLSQPENASSVQGDVRLSLAGASGGRSSKPAGKTPAKASE